jgi:RNA polymerase sigma-70 factor, ECF subfamily
VEVAVTGLAGRQDEDLLLLRAQSGDTDAFLALVAPHDRALRALAYRLLGDAGVMDDVLHTAYANAYRALHSFSGRSAVSTWLYRIAYNACLDELRRRRRTRAVAAAAPLPSPPDPADVVAQRLDVGLALAELPAELRAAVLLVDGDGLPYDDAASVLGIRTRTLASRLSRARAELRAALSIDTEER